ncbi:MAG: hypothetical protein N3A54_06815, partial [Patescibacteria group bacterium]|nr:hypothetical protein [Patescibacteria group bacterium]
MSTDSFLHKRGNDWYLLTVLEESGQDHALLAQEPVRGLWLVFDEEGRMGYAPNDPQAQWVEPEDE